MALHLSSRHESSEFIPKEYSHSSRIKLTLQEEQLVPPPPLPPEAFRDAINEQPRLSGADRDWSRLDPAFVQTVLRVMAKMEARGFPMTLLEGYRSAARQDALAGQATLVTKAKGGQSKHQYGLAVDLAPVRNGKVVISERDPWAMQAYVALGEEAGAASLTWGGNWSFKDYGHIERSGSLKQLLSANNKPTGR
ncbi:peptidoglycan L-alanyl-D-glutamate endopeptidase CwlK [Vogesella sp. LIG4]|nr:peptidoglycan L-alanyl-D-glutamate endopeptidase CwlK [Vogesella sp. LIG4]